MKTLPYTESNVQLIQEFLDETKREFQLVFLSLLPIKLNLNWPN